MRTRHRNLRCREHDCDGYKHLQSLQGRCDRPPYRSGRSRQSGDYGQAAESKLIQTFQNKNYAALYLLHEQSNVVFKFIRVSPKFEAAGYTLRCAHLCKGRPS